MNTVYTSGFGTIVSIIIGIIFLVLKIYQSSNSATKGSSKKSSNSNFDLKQFLEKTVQAQQNQSNTYSIDESDDYEVEETLNKYNNDLYKTVAELKGKNDEWIPDNIEINEKGRYNTYTIDKKRKKQNYKKIFNSRNAARNAFVASQIFEPKFKS